MADENTPNPTGGTVDLAEAVKAIISKAGEPNKAVEMLLEDNFKLREKNRTHREKIEQLTGEVDSLKERKVVGEGEVVLSGDEAKAWSSIKEQGGIEAFQSATEELSSLKKEKRQGDVARIMGWNAKVLARIGGDLEYEIQTEGDKPTVLVKDGDKQVPLDKYAEREWKEFAPALHTGTPGRKPPIKQPPIDLSGPRDISDEDVKQDQDERLTLEI